MIAICIPTYMEADNISLLVRSIDVAALQLDIPILIINADNNSSDNTSSVFLETPTKAAKISLKTFEKGKGVNLKKIFELVAEDPDIDSCMCIDGDITSFKPDWLSEYSKTFQKGADYIIPRYKRSYQEGNTTNHFVYPSLAIHMGGAAPRQPISGDFGLSKKFVKHLAKTPWAEPALGYGVDIFMTLQALYGNFNVYEVALSSKLHKPSFYKMIGMFKEVAFSYYVSMGILKQHGKLPNSTLVLADKMDDLLESNHIPNEHLQTRIDQALDIYRNTLSLIPSIKPNSQGFITAQQWAEVLVLHERMIGKVNARTLADSILPWYLLRSTSYLKTVSSPEDASREIDSQFLAILKEYKS